MMKTPLVFACLALVTLAVKASAEGNTGTEGEAHSQIDELLPVDPGGSPGDSIDIDEAGTDNEESRDRNQEVKEPAEDEERNFNDFDNERNDGTKDDDNPYEYSQGNDGKDDIKELADLKPDSAEEDAYSVKLSTEQEGSPLPPGTGIQDSAGEQMDVQETEGKNPSSAGSFQSQIEGAALNGLPHLPDLPLLSPKSQAEPSGINVNSQSLGPDSGNQASKFQSPVAANAMPHLPQLPARNQGGMANPIPETGSSNTYAQAPSSSSQNSGAPYVIPKLPDLSLLSGNQATFSNPNTDLNKTAGSVPHQGSASLDYSLPKLPNLPGLSPDESQIKQAPSTSPPALGLGESSNLLRLPALSDHESDTKQSQISNQMNSASITKGQDPAPDAGFSSMKAAGDEGLPHLPKLSNLPSLSNPPTADSLMEQANLNSRIPSAEKNPSGPFMTGTQVERTGPLIVDGVNQNQRNDQAGLKTIQVPSERFGDGNTASTGLATNIDPTRMTLGGEDSLSNNDQDGVNHSSMEEEDKDRSDNFYPDNSKDHIVLHDQTEQEHEGEDNGVSDGDNEPNPQGRPETSDNVRTGAAEETTVKTKAPNKPSNMVLFYTWLILIVLTAVVTISTCKSRIMVMFNLSKKGPGHQRQPEDGKRLLDHEYV